MSAGTHDETKEQRRRVALAIGRLERAMEQWLGLRTEAVLWCTRVREWVQRKDSDHGVLSTAKAALRETDGAMVDALCDYDDIAHEHWPPVAVVRAWERARDAVDEYEAALLLVMPSEQYRVVYPRSGG